MRAMDRIFLRALIVSLFGHMLLFFPWSGFTDRPSRQSFQDIEISYFEVKPNPPLEIKETTSVSAAKKEEKQSEQNKIAVKEPPQPREKKETLPEPKKEEKKSTPVLSKEEQLVARDFAALSREPVFLDYYRAIREKIKISANRHKPAFFKPGEVCVFFLLNNQGELRRLKIIEAKSSPDAILRDTALSSVEDASPFPPFPQELKREQIAFNIIIAFEVK